MTVTKHAAAAVGLVAIPAVVATKAVLRALEGPDFLDPTVPPPCWVPVHLHDRSTHVHAGTTATLRVHLTNLGAEPQDYEIATNTPAATISAPSVTLGPLEHADLVLELPVAANTPHGPLAPVVITARGCKTYRLRWLIHVSPRIHAHVKHHSKAYVHHVTKLHQHLVTHHEVHHPLHRHHGFFGHGALHSVDIHDQPDYQHHWYDHFYSECSCDHDD